MSNKYFAAFLALVVVPLADLQTIDQPAAASDVIEQAIDVAAVSGGAEKEAVETVEETVPVEDVAEEVEEEAVVDAAPAEEEVAPEVEEAAPAVEEVKCDAIIPDVDGNVDCDADHVAEVPAVEQPSEGDATISSDSQAGLLNSILKFLHLI